MFHCGNKQKIHLKHVLSPAFDVAIGVVVVAEIPAGFYLRSELLKWLYKP